MAELKSAGELKIVLDGDEYTLLEEDLIIETAQVPGYEASSDKGVTVVLDTNLTDKLIEEGFVREIVSKIQTMRKDNGFEVLDKITVYSKGNDKIKEVIQKNSEEIKVDVLAVDIIFDGDFSGALLKEWNINGENVELGVKKN